MGRRKKTHQPLAYALIPRALYAALGQGAIDPTAFAVWATIRLYVRDTVRGEFSPPPIDLTNREIAEATGLTVRQTVNVLNHLEEAQCLQRLTAEEMEAQNLSGNRWLQLLQPISMQSISLKSEEVTISNPVGETSVDPASADSSACASSELEGGLGGTENPAAHFNETRCHETDFNEKDFNATQFKAIARTLQACGVYRAPSFEIANTMLAEDPHRTPHWAEETFYQVFNAERRAGVTEDQAMRRTVTRLKNGDWNTLADVVAEAERRQQSQRPTVDQAQLARLLQPPTLSPAQKLWRQVLEDVELQMTRATFDAWLRQTQALEIDGPVLVVQAKDRYAVEWLTNRLYTPILRSLQAIVQTWPPDNGGGVVAQVSDIDFVTPGA